jgi:hypothetical protein
MVVAWTEGCHRVVVVGLALIAADLHCFPVLPLVPGVWLGMEGCVSA